MSLGDFTGGNSDWIWYAGGVVTLLVLWFILSYITMPIER